MKHDSFIAHNFDKLMLFTLIILGGILVMHIVHHDGDNMQAITWAETAFSTILGALILILTGRGQPLTPSSTTTSTNNGQPSPPPTDISGKLKVNAP